MKDKPPLVTSTHEAVEHVYITAVGMAQSSCTRIDTETRYQ